MRALIDKCKQYFNQKDDIEGKLDAMISKTNNLLEQYSAFYQPINFEAFSDMPLEEWIELNENARIQLLKRNEHEINFVARFGKGNLNYHNHPDAIEVFMLLDGEGELIVKDRYGANIIKKEKFIKGKIYTVDIGLHHKFIVTENAITWGQLRKMGHSND